MEEHSKSIIHVGSSLLTHIILLEKWAFKFVFTFYFEISPYLNIFLYISNKVRKLLPQAHKYISHSKFHNKPMDVLLLDIMTWALSVLALLLYILMRDQVTLLCTFELCPTLLSTHKTFHILKATI